MTVVRDRVSASNTGRGYAGGPRARLDPFPNLFGDRRRGRSSSPASAQTARTTRSVKLARRCGQTIYEADERQIPPDQHLQMSTQTAAQLAMTRQASRPASVSAPSAPRAAGGTTTDTGTNIDMLVAYTPQARMDAGGTDAIVAQINSAVGEAKRPTPIARFRRPCAWSGRSKTAYTSAGLQSGLIPDLQRVTGPQQQ